MSDAQTSFNTITGGFIKRNYGKGAVQIKIMQNLRARLFDSLTNSDETPSGEGFFVPVNVAGNESGGAANESETFHNAQSVTDVQFQIKPKTTFWPFQITGYAMDLTTSNADSFARTLPRQMKDNSGRFFSDLNRQCWGVATGQMTTVNGAQSSVTTITVRSIQYFRTDMRIDIWTAVGGTRQVTNARITSINTTTPSITIDQTVTVSDAAIIVKTGVLDNAPSDYKEFFGMQALVDTTIYNTSIQGVSKTTYPVLQSYVKDAGGATITNAILQTLETSIENQCEQEVAVKWSDRTQRDRYIELLVPMKRFMSDDTLDSGKRKPIEHNGKPWEVDKDCPSGMVFATIKDYAQKYVLTEPDIVDRDGNTISRLPNSDVYQGYYKTHMNLGTLQPNGAGKIFNLG